MEQTTAIPAGEARPNPDQGEPAMDQGAGAAPAPASTAAPAPDSLLDDATATDAPAEATPPTTPVVPEEYAFAPPEIDGRPLAFDAAALDDFKAMARDLGLTQDQFQGVAARGAERLQAVLAKTAAEGFGSWVADMANRQSDAWAADIRADPAIGGDRLPDTLRLAAKAMDQFGGDGFRAGVKAANLQNYPPLVAMLARVGRAMGDVSGLSAGAPAAPPRTAAQAAQAIYDFRDAAPGSP